MANPMGGSSPTPSHRPAPMAEEPLPQDQLRDGNPPTQDELTPQGTHSMVTTYQTRASSAAEHQYFLLRSRRAAAELVDPPTRPAVPLRRCRVNMTVIVDIEGILPEGCVHFLTGEPLLNMDLVPIFEFHSEAQLHNTMWITSSGRSKTFAGNVFVCLFEKGISNSGSGCCLRNPLDIHMENLSPYGSSCTSP